MRVAIYFTPAEDHPLTIAAAKWLMRSAFSGEILEPPDNLPLPVDELRELTAEPRRYGFHATMKAPFRLADGFNLSDLGTALAIFCRETSPIAITDPIVGQLGRFFAIIPAAPNAAVNGLAAKVVEAFEPFRAPLNGAELARRRQTSMTPTQEANLVHWGYPYVFDDFRFHMTLTGPVAPDRQSGVHEVLLQRFGPFVEAPLQIDSLALFVEGDSDPDFKVQARFPFGRP